MTEKCTILCLSRGDQGKPLFFWKPVSFCQCQAKPSVGHKKAQKCI